MVFNQLSNCVKIVPLRDIVFIFSVHFDVIVFYDFLKARIEKKETVYPILL